MTNFLLVAQQVAILFVLIGAGMICRKARLVDEFAIRGMVNVLILIVTPAIVIDCFQRPFDPTMLRQLGLAFVIATAAHLVAIALACVTARGDERTLPVLRVATVFSNAGFMGIPLEYAILGAKGVFFGIVYVAMFNVFMWTWGLREMRGHDVKSKSEKAKSAENEKVKVKGEGEEKVKVEGQGQEKVKVKGEGEQRNDSSTVQPLTSNLQPVLQPSTFNLQPLLKSLVNPGTVGLAIGLPLFLFSVTLPEIVGKPVHMLAELNTPFAMLVIGYYLAGADLKSLVKIPAVHTAAFVRLVAFPLIVLGGLWLVRGWLDRTMALAMMTAASAPAAAMVTMFASKYNRDVDMSVGLVSGTTILSIFTMPAIIAIAMEVL